MKFNLIVRVIFGLLIVACANGQVQAQLTWDPDADNVNNGGTGTWDTVSAIWDGVVTDQTWVNGSDAIFGDAGANYTVSIADGGITVGDLDYQGTNTLRFQSVNDDMGIINVATGGGTWDTGGGQIEFLANQTADVILAANAGDTLTITGGGEFDTGERPNNATWQVAGATLEITDPTIVRGHAASVGQFDTVRIESGSTYVHERNANQTYLNDWDLTGNGLVSIGNRFNRDVNLNGVVSGTAGLRFSNGGTSSNFQFRLNNTANSFTGGVVVDNVSANNFTILNVVGGDGALGAVPTTFDADNITLRDGGILRLFGINVDANRGILLDGGGNIVNAGVNTINGVISGTGDLQIGNDASEINNNVNTVTLNGTNTYDGDTNIVRGTIIMGVDDALPNGTVVRIGGTGSTARLDTNGFDSTIGGLQTVGNNTRILANNSSVDSTLTIDVAAGEMYTYSGNIDTNGSLIDIVKDGAGLQKFARNAAFTEYQGSFTVNDGILQLDTGDFSGVNSPNSSTINGGTLGVDGTLGGPVTVNAGSFSPGSLNMTTMQTLAGTATLDDSFVLGAGGSLDFDLDGANLAIGGGVNDLITGVTDLTLDGMLNVTDITAGNFMTAMAGDIWRLIDYSGTLTDNGLDIGSAPALSSGLAYQIDTSVTGQVNLIIIAVPEPSSLMFLGLGGLALFSRRRRRV